MEKKKIPEQFVPVGVIELLYPDELKFFPGKWKELNIKITDSLRRAYMRIK